MLYDILQQIASRYGSREALVFGSRRYRYADVVAYVERCAAGLERCGAGADRGVALVLNNSPEFIFTLLATARLGAPALLLDPASKPAELRRFLREHVLAAAVCESEHSDLLEQIRADCRIRFHLFTRGGNFDLLCKSGGRASAKRTHEDEIAIVQYSSGSTGMPKCVARSFRNLYWEALDFNETVAVKAEDRILCTIPLFHAHGLANAFFASLYAGATLVLAEEFSRAVTLDLLVREAVTILPSVPLILDLLAAYVRGEVQKRRHSLRLVFTAGAPLPVPTARGFHEQFGLFPRQLYGSTELGSASINLDPDPEETLDSVGHPMRNVRIEIFREDGRLAPTGETGEVGVQSPAMPAGYWNQPDLTREKFRSGFFFPGDYGKRSSSGHLYLEGRSPVLISSAGKKVDPREVEAVIACHPKVKEVVVVGVAGRYGDQVVKAVVVSQEVCLEEEIVSHCRAKLADYKIPRRVEFVNQIPRSPSGKILRKDMLS
jgi:long-chain acyl-CoA synthetase